MISANLPYFVFAVLFLIGLLGALLETNLIKIGIAIDVMESAANMFIIVLGYRAGGYIPVKFLMPEGVTNIADEAFRRCISLRELTLPVTLAL